MRARGPTATLLVCAAACAGYLAPSGARADAPGIGLRPATVDGVDPVTDGFLDEAVAPGGAVSGAVVASNTTSSAVPLAVYAAEGVTAVTTGAVFTDGDPATGTGAWVRPSVTSLVLAGGAQAQIDFTVQVPSGAAPGDHVAAIVIAQAPAASSGATFSVSEVVRSVVPIDIRVSGTATAQAQVSSLSVGDLPGTSLPAVMVGLSDTGHLMCRPQLAVTVSQPDGERDTVTRQLEWLLPGDEIRLPLAWPQSLAADDGLAATATSCGDSSSFTAPATTTGGGAQTGQSGGATPGAATRPHSAATPSGLSPAAAPAPRPAPATPPRRRPRPAAVSRPHGRPRLGTARADRRGALATGLTHRPRRPRARGEGSVVGTVLRAALRTAGFPISLLAAMVMFILLQDAIDRRDPKLALAPAYSDPQLSFDADPFAEV